MFSNRWVYPTKEGKINQNSNPQIDKPQKKPPANGEGCSFIVVILSETNPEIIEIAIIWTRPTTIEANSGHHPLTLVNPKYIAGEKNKATYPIMIETAYLKENPLNIAPI